MNTVQKAVLASVALMVATPALSAPSGKPSWFRDTSFVGVGTLGAPSSRLLNPSDTSTFGVNLFKSGLATSDVDTVPDAIPLSLDVTTVRLYGELESPSARDRSFSSLTNPDATRVNTFGITWKHRLNALNSLSFSAEYGEGTAIHPQTFDTYDTRAAISWTSVLPSSVKPSITGSVFLGDELSREDLYRNLGRKYYGFVLGGSLTLSQAHTPYVSFKMQRSLTDNVDDLSLVSQRNRDRSLLSAGWKWQIQRDFSLQAEASYGLGESSSSLDPYSLERSRILFGTRYGF